MDKLRLLELRGFYENELTNNLLSFWLPRSIDTENGGFFNCFTNDGSQLLSRDKYTWSQGRFVWTFARLAMLDAPVFSQKQKGDFLDLARSGLEFLKKHCLVGPDDWRCVYLMDEKGQPKTADDSGRLDLSIYADCFVIGAFARYALAAADRPAYAFASRLYQSALDRIKSGDYLTHPYPLSEQYRAHGIPMIMSNVTCEMIQVAASLDPAALPGLEDQLDAFVNDILANFASGEDVVHEIISRDNEKLPNMLGQHANPGHTIECMWFVIEAGQLLDRPDLIRRAAAITKKTCAIGWDEEYGGLLHYSHVEGGPPSGSTAGVSDEPMLQQVLAGWGDKLWWVHSEALYTTLLCYDLTGEAAFLDLYNKLAKYTFSTFPNPNRTIREWIQIRQRDGSPQEKVVALPVKDPYHILRNVIQLIELLDKMEAKS